jgi:hypothetical protein
MLTLVANSPARGVAAPHGRDLRKAGRSPLPANARLIDSRLSFAAQEGFVSDVIPILSGRSRTVDHFEAAESMDGTPAWRIRIQPRRCNVAAS